MPWHFDFQLNNVPQPSELNCTMTKHDLQQLIVNNEMDSLFDELKARKSYFTEVVMLESQWKDLQTRLRTGIVSNDQATMEAARVRMGLLEIVDMSFSKRQAPSVVENLGTTVAVVKPTGQARAAIIAVSVLSILLLGILLFRLIGHSGENLRQNAESNQAASTPAIADKKSAKFETLNTSAATPITLAPGDFQYERVYSVINGSMENIGAGQRLITLKIGLNFKGIINTVLSNDDFRLMAPELHGPLAPSNFLSVLIDSKSYGEGEVKFEISDAIKRFSVIVEDKPSKKWDFTIE